MKIWIIQMIKMKKKLNYKMIQINKNKDSSILKLLNKIRDIKKE